jgi:hypothetical protein
MSDIVEVVKTEMQSAYRNGRAKASGKPVEDIVLPNEFVFETLAHTAIKATLEHLIENITDDMIEACAVAADDAKDEAVRMNFVRGRAHPRAFADLEWLPQVIKAALSQAIKEMEI